jgi:ERCC4-type nuclease
VDSREQAPYRFESIPLAAAQRKQGKRLVVPTEFRTLVSGDYSIIGCESRVAVERKSLEDLYSTLGQGRERFEKEVERLNDLECAAVVVEASWSEIIRPADFRVKWRSELNPASVAGTMFAWAVRYRNVRWIVAKNRRGGMKETFGVLSEWWARSRKHNHKEE